MPKVTITQNVKQMKYYNAANNNMKINPESF